MSGEPDLCLRCCGRFAAAFIVDHHNLHPEDNHTELGLYGQTGGKKIPGGGHGKPLSSSFDFLFDSESG
jgi:hypothetical protein